MLCSPHGHFQTIARQLPGGVISMWFNRLKKLQCLLLKLVHFRTEVLQCLSRLMASLHSNFIALQPSIAACIIHRRRISMLSIDACPASGNAISQPLIQRSIALFHLVLNAQPGCHAKQLLGLQLETLPLQYLQLLIESHAFFQSSDSLVQLLLIKAVSKPGYLALQVCALLPELLEGIAWGIVACHCTFHWTLETMLGAHERHQIILLAERMPQGWLLLRLQG
mmetsp:Transcript_44835/g.103719  ORF Transcript_44835/g.103719 Transcript_44835/m.103719 type:complete len:224 (-) Transcript_44835:16-687(-)